jgi:hypothetical protein
MSVVKATFIVALVNTTLILGLSMIVFLTSLL